MHGWVGGGRLPALGKSCDTFSSWFLFEDFSYGAIDCATTHLFGPGLKIQIRNAIEKGAKPGEVMEVFELASLMGVQTVLLGAEALAKARGEM